MLTPAMIPVTAGKNTANTTQKFSRGTSARGTVTISGGPTELPRKNEMSDTPIAPMMKYWARMAARADFRASAATSTVVRSPTSRSSTCGNTFFTDSAKPIVYRATDRACAKNSGMPTAPPVSIPSERLIM